MFATPEYHEPASKFTVCGASHRRQAAILAARSEVCQCVRFRCGDVASCSGAEAEAAYLALAALVDGKFGEA